MNDRKAIVTFATGRKYLLDFDRTFRPSLERYARSTGHDLVIIPELIRPTDKPRFWFWQKFLVWEHPVVKQYGRITLMDADIFVTRHAKDVFAAVGDLGWGMVVANPYNDPVNAVTDLRYYDDCPAANRPPVAGNVGVTVISRKYEPDLLTLYDQYAGKEARGYETGPLCYLLFNDEKNGVYLDAEFNVPVTLYIRKHGHSLSSILRMYDGASFIHFVGGKWRSVFYFLRWFEGSPVWQQRLVRWAARPGLDGITSAGFSSLQWMTGIYEYRIRKQLFGLVASKA